MKIQEAIEFIENFEVPERLEKAGETIKESLGQLPQTDYEEIGTHFYYLLRVVLRSHILFEKDIAKYYYRKMSQNFQKQEERYLEELGSSDKKEVVKMQLDVFYQMMERYFSSLEIIYDKKDFLEATERAFREKMAYRKNAHHFRAEYGHYFLYKFLEASSDYGTSFLRWGVTSIVFIGLFALTFALLDLFGNVALKVGHWYDFIYFSTTTFTTLGYGDIVPTSFIGKVIANIEAFTGFVMLGTFIGLIQKKLL